MWRLLKFLLYFVGLGTLGLVVYAYVADLTPDQVRVNEPVTLEVD